MAGRIEAFVKPELLRWARDSAGLEIGSAAKKIQVSSAKLESWELGTARPTIKQLRNLSRVYKRPMAVFYLEEPPRGFQAIRDFRQVPGEMRKEMSPNLLQETRRAQNRREIAIELSGLIGEESGLSPDQLNLADDPEDDADILRSLLGVRKTDQKRWRSGYDALNGWKSAIERSGTLVFQAEGVDVDEMRGFSIGERPMPIIVVNVRDTIAGRIFTMIHELSHILLRLGGLCDLDENPELRTEEQRVEVFCNHVAGATLIPRDDLLAEPQVLSNRGRSVWHDNDIKTLADGYGTSREALLRRLLIFGLTSSEFYREKRQQFRDEYALTGTQEGSRKGGFVPPDVRAVSSGGRSFARLVLNSYYRDNITISDVSDFLEVRLKHLDKIEAAVFGRSGGALT
jgi:Zn-dependent peptidase ImmA (M78 family)/transcriptional regulator with XRE-family HTH domain